MPSFSSTIHTPHPTGLSRPWAVMHCTRECLKIEDCHSFVLTASSDICYLTNFSRCADPTSVLYRNVGFQTYDVRRDRNTLDETCFDACGNCEDCGRRNCRGLLCDDCAYACWDEGMGSKSGFQHLWPKSTPKYRKDIECDGFWQKVWGRTPEGAIEFSVYNTLWKERLTLRLTVTYDEEDTVHSFFDSFEYSKGSISVGEFLQGDAGNFWEAPFSKRALVATEGCLAFFYAGGSCPVPRGQEPVYYWRVNDSERDSKVIKAIELWIRP